MLAEDINKLNKLKGDLRAIEARITMAKMNLTTSRQLLSVSLMSLMKERERVVEEIAELSPPHDFTPNPGGSTPTPAAALRYA